MAIYLHKGIYGVLNAGPIADAITFFIALVIFYSEYRKLSIKEKPTNLEDIKVNNTLGMDNPYFYRNKIQMPLRLDKKRNIVSGFYQERTHNIIPMAAPIHGFLVWNGNLMFCAFSTPIT